MRIWSRTMPAAAARRGCRTEKEKRQHQFGEEHHLDAEKLPPVWKLRGEPRKWCRERLGEIMELQRGTVRPRRITAREFDHAGTEHQAEQQPHHQEAGDARRISRAETPAQRGEKERKKSRLEEKQIPLKAVKILPCDGERKIGAPKKNQSGHGHESREHERRDGRPGDAQSTQDGV